VSDDAPRPEPVDAVLAANAAFYEAVEEGDLDALGGIWVDGELSAGAVCVHPGMEPIRGRSAVLRSWAAVMAGTPYIQFVITDVAAAVVGGSAVVSCTENLLTAPEGMPVTSFAGGRAVATNVFRLGPDGWRLWVHHASPVLTRRADTAG
jgi:ketosteroid isomerase-like protein